MKAAIPRRLPLEMIKILHRYGDKVRDHSTLLKYYQN
jgi:hypothetical protein